MVSSRQAKPVPRQFYQLPPKEGAKVPGTAVARAFLAPFFFLAFFSSLRKSPCAGSLIPVASSLLSS
jgi:hypothetical protein